MAINKINMYFLLTFLVILLMINPSLTTAALLEYSFGIEIDDVRNEIVVDLNNDNHNDIVLNTKNHGLRVYWNNGDGSFNTYASYSEIQGNMLSYADFNQDGWFDIAISDHPDDKISIMLNDKTGNLNAPIICEVTVKNAREITAEDFNQDNIPDIAVGRNWVHITHGIQILLGNGDGTFTEGQFLENSIGGGPLTCGDVNQDSIPDLIYMPYDHYFAVGSDNKGYGHIYINNGDGSFTLGPSQYEMGIRPSGIVAADFNEDDKLDFASSSDDSGGFYLFLGNGDGTFLEGEHFDGGPDSPGDISCGDYDNDGHIDIVLPYEWTCKLVVFKGNGNGDFTKEQSTAISCAFYSLSSGLINSDAIVDLVVGLYNASGVDTSARVFVGNSAPTVTTQAVTNISTTTATGNGNITVLGCPNPTQHGVCWSTSENPTIVLSTKTEEGAKSTTGSFTSNITSLTPGTVYHARAYATNNVGTSYGGEVSFTTYTTTATVTTTAISSITSTSASSGGNVTSDGGASITARGVCWSTSENPTTSDIQTSDGTGAGSFTSSITGLSSGTTYHVRAYATNSEGTSYGSDVPFTASAIAPMVSTTAVSSVTSTSASSGGNVTSDGGASITARGVCWSTSENPTTSDIQTSDGTGAGSFTSSITGLSSGTTYHVRAYATNSEGTSYGSDVPFTASAIAPMVSTTAVSSVTSTSASSGGNVTSDGGASITARGVCWSTSENPTTSDIQTSDGTG